MTEPTTADREAAHAALANYWHSNNPAANADMARQVARFLAAARAEERERCAKRISALAAEPDVSATADEHLIGFKSGWHTAIRRAVGEISE
jgi:hypothetical protein